MNNFPELKIFNEKEKKQIIEKLELRFGIRKIDGLLLKRGEERIFLFQGEFSREDIKRLERITNVERVGTYIGKEMNGEIRLSIEGSQILKDQINKNILDLTYEQAKEWMMGKELLISLPKDKQGFVIMKYKNDLLGTGKASENKITNFIPKNRRLKK